jgi:hypothetical protein
MATESKDSPTPAEPRRRLILDSLWAALAIVAIWLAVLFDAVYSSDMTITSNDGTHLEIPTAPAVALFATIATALLGWWGFGSSKSDD